MIDMQDKMGIPPVKVAEAIEHALTSAHPKAHYLVGKDARMQNAMFRMLPIKARDALLRKVLKI
jgi:hypothetical protein